MPRFALRTRRSDLAPILIGIALTFANGAAALAAPPAAIDLNPAPPDVYTCTPVGAGTICRGHAIEPYNLEPTGILCGSGAATVELLDSAIRIVDATRWYDADGNLIRRLRTNAFRDAYLTNPATGQTLVYSQRSVDNEILAVPGDLDSATLTGHGHISITAPGYGGVIVTAGRTVFGPAGDIEAQSGPSELDDYFAGDSALVDDLCAALGTPNH